MECILDNEQRDFWQESKKIHSKAGVPPPCVDDDDNSQDMQTCLVFHGDTFSYLCIVVSCLLCPKNQIHSYNTRGK